jgi:FKBP-type peptidyl-prolyl cis-trans isomerase
MKGQRERAPEPILNTEPAAAALDIKNQQGRAWKQAKVNNLHLGMAYLNQNKTLPDVKTLKSGVQYKVLAAGSGAKPKKRDSVEIAYKGSLIDGTVFVDTTTGQPAAVKLDSLIPGLAQALKHMPAGSKWQVVVPPDQGYGDNGAPPTVGPGAVLIYEMELLKVVAGKTDSSAKAAGAAE